MSENQENQQQQTAIIKVKPDKVNELFGIGPDEQLEIKEKIATPNGHLLKMIHRYKGYEIWSSVALVAEDADGLFTDAGSSGLARGLENLTERLNFEAPPPKEHSIAACQTYIVETNLLPIITNAAIRNRYLYLYNRSSSSPGPVVFADEIQIDGDSECGEPFSRVLLYDAIGRRVINSWNTIIKDCDEETAH